MISNNGPRDAAEYQDELEAIEQELHALEAAEIDDLVAAQLNDVMSKARNIKKAADNDRKAIKQPFLDGGRDVDARFKPVTTALDGFVGKAKKLLTPYLEEQARVAAEAERLAREEAEKKARAAEILADDADVRALADKARANLTVAQAQAESSGRAGSVTGMARTASLRTYYDAVISDPFKAAAHFATNPKVMELVCSLAEAEMRADRTKSIKVPGIEFKERKEVA